MHQPLVSVVIATFNMGRYLPEAVQSVLAQTWKNLELIVIDDGSSDNTREVMAPFLGDPRVRYLPQSNLGQPKAKNAGIKACNGEFIGFCDADDLWEPRKLEMQMPHFVANPAVGVVYSSVAQMDDQGRIFNDKGHDGHSGKITDQLLIFNFIPFGTAVVRRKCLDEHGIFDESLPMGIDWDLWLRISTSWEFFFVRDITYRYRVWSGQMSGNLDKRYKNAIKIMRKFVQQFPGAAPQSVIKRAWSDMYAGRAMAIAQRDGLIMKPLADAATAVWKDPSYVRAWKSIVKILIRKY